jgi:hypothetical protein
MTDQDDQAVTLKIEQRADRFALVRNHKGQKTELMLMETDILALARMIPSYARALAAPRHRPEAGAAPAMSYSIMSYSMAMDTDAQHVLLKIRDDREAEFDFAFAPSDARKIAESLTIWAQRVEEAPKPSRQ